MCIDIFDALEALECAFSARKDVFVCKKIILAVLGAGKVEHDVDKNDVIDASINELPNDCVNLVAGPFLVPQ